MIVERLSNTAPPCTHCGSTQTTCERTIVEWRGRVVDQVPAVWCFDCGGLVVLPLKLSAHPNPYARPTARKAS